MRDRIIEFLKAENKTSAQFAEDIGVQPSGISHILSGRNKPSLDFILKMLEKYKFLSTEWLLFGKGNMYREQVIPDLFSQPPVETGEVFTGRIDKPDDAKPSENESIKQAEESHDQFAVEKIVWFYNNNTFREYFPEKE